MALAWLVFFEQTFAKESDSGIAGVVAMGSPDSGSTPGGPLPMTNQVIQSLTFDKI